MTVSYSLQVATIHFWGFLRLLPRWRGSIYKLLWREIIIFLLMYYSLSLLYWYGLTETQQKVFEDISLYCKDKSQSIPLSFVLGFYVTQVIGRWWNMFTTIPWPDRAAGVISCLVNQSDERSNLIRRTLVRYLLLIQVLTFQNVSIAVKKRFPTRLHLEEAGLITEEERKVLEKMDISAGAGADWWLPAQWYTALVMRAKKEERIPDFFNVRCLLEELNLFMEKCRTVLHYDWVSLPLVYTQVVTIATYTYFGIKLLGEQYLRTETQTHKYEIVDFYFPLAVLLQYFFFMGWLKVAEQIINPYGDDDDDFELNWCIDRNIQVIFLFVDQLRTKHPKLRPDKFINELNPKLPHTKYSANIRSNGQIGSATNIDISENEEFIPFESYIEEDRESNIIKPPVSKQDSSKSILRHIHRKHKRAKNENSIDSRRSSSIKDMKQATIPENEEVHDNDTVEMKSISDEKNDVKLTDVVVKQNEVEDVKDEDLYEQNVPDDVDKCDETDKDDMVCLKQIESEVESEQKVPESLSADN